MGDPPKLRDKYSRPKRLWDVDRIKEDKTLKSEYGLKNMKELWVAVAELKKYRREARRLLSLSEEMRSSDTVKILAKLNKLGILEKTATLEDILSLTVKSILERRLQTIVYRKGLAHTLRQSRQLITHGFIAVGGRKVSAPSYFIDVNEEQGIAYSKAIDLTKNPPQTEQPAEASEAKNESAENAS